MEKNLVRSWSHIWHFDFEYLHCDSTAPKANEPWLYSINEWHGVSLWAWKWKQMVVRGSFTLQAFIILVRCKNSTVEHGFASKQHQVVTFLSHNCTYYNKLITAGNLPFWPGKSCFWVGHCSLLSFPSVWLVFSLCWGLKPPLGATGCHRDVFKVKK